jgi:hypothetical protein
VTKNLNFLELNKTQVLLSLAEFIIYSAVPFFSNKSDKGSHACVDAQMRSLAQYGNIEPGGR